VDEVHGSASITVKCVTSSRGRPRNGRSGSGTSVPMGAIDDSVIKVTDSTKVAKIVKNAKRADVR